MIRTAILALGIIFAAPVPANSELWIESGSSLTPEDVLELVGIDSEDTTDRRLVWRFQSPALPLMNTAASAVSISVVDADFDRKNGRLDAQLRAQLATGESSRLKVVAQATSERLVPVPARDLGRGQAIAPSDLEKIWFDERRLSRDMITRTGEIMGLETTRKLRAGRPIPASSVRPPRDIKRGELVEVVFDQGGLRLTLLAEAAEDGIAGQMVRLRNVDSGRRIIAVADGRRRARIGGDVK